MNISILIYIYIWIFYSGIKVNNSNKNEDEGLCCNKSLVITKPDNGLGMVISNWDDYVNKMLSVLDDKKIFIRLRLVELFDKTKTIEF